MGRVQVYRNLHKSREGSYVYSLRCKKTRKVLEHRSLLMLRHCSFFVSVKGRERVLKKRQKNVHAWVEGVLFDEALPTGAFYNGFILARLSYDPYLSSHFILEDGSCPEVGSTVFFTPEGAYVLKEAE